MKRSLCVFGLVLLATCTNGPTGPEPGALKLMLADPNAGADGALLIALSGPASPGAVAGAPGDTVWGGPFTGPANQLVVTGQLANGVILTFDVPDVTVAAQYQALVLQAASTSDYSLRSLSGYHLTVSR